MIAVQPANRIRLGFGIVVAAAVLSIAFYFLDVPGTALILFAVLAAVWTVRRFDGAFAILFLLSMGVSYELLLDLRPSVHGTALPVNAIDFATGLMALAFLVNLGDRRERVRWPAHLRMPMAAFSVTVCFGLLYGLYANSSTLYVYFRDTRMIVTLYLTALGVSRFIRTPEQLRFVARLFVGAALLCSLQQMSHLLFGGNTGPTSVRDVSLPIQVLSMAIAFLVLHRYHGIALLPRNSYPFVVALFAFSILISLTRTAWIMVVLSYLLAMRYMGSRQRAQALLIGGIAAAIVIFVLPFAIDLYSHGMNLVSLLQERFGTLAGSNDLSTQYRLANIADAWIDYLKSPVWGHGIGHPIYVFQPDLGGVVEAEHLHNSYLFWGLKLGGLGLGAFIWLMVAPLFRTAEIAVLQDDSIHPEVTAFAQSMVAAITPFLLVGPWSGNENFVGFMPLLGLYIGLNWDRVLESSRQPTEPSTAPVHGDAVMGSRT